MSSYDSIKDRVNIVGDKTFVNQVTDTLSAIYEGYALAAAAIESWLYFHSPFSLEIDFAAGESGATPGFGPVRIDPSYFTNDYYVSQNGQAVHHTFEFALAHEVCHVVTSLKDNDSFHDLAGTTSRQLINGTPS